ncbi:MAG: exodeoxyribonuclease VII large subunit [Alphaproteobacteria bacterium]|nr:exodeoxyribonuclease VII large subunit [Alphaproteobacteria bacterium]
MRRVTVRQLTQELTTLLSARYPALEVEGEVSNLTVAGSGHAYLTLRDGDAALAAVCWADTWRSLDHRPKRDERVVCRGRLGVYGGKGAYQLYVHGIAPAGEGAWAAELARRKARLEADGLLEPRRKRPLPAHPRVVGVATSLTGAALQDFLEVSRERHPATRILLAGCQVQGERAPASIVQAVELLVDDGRCEVIVVTRGGGSKEDLRAFQDEGLARYLAHCPVPVVSAVGHQIDTTLADLVADAVAPTPTAAAVLVLPDGGVLRQRVDEGALALEAAVARRLRDGRRELVRVQGRLRHPAERLAQVRRRADELVARAAAVIARRLPARRAELRALEGRALAAWRRVPPGGRHETEALRRRLALAVQQLLRDRRAAVARSLAQVEALSPQRVLERGYAVVVGPDGAVSSAAAVRAGDRVSVRLRDGSFGAVVDAEAVDDRERSDG